MRKGASLAARQTEPADVEVLNIAASAPIFKKKKKELVRCRTDHNVRVRRLLNKAKFDTAEETIKKNTVKR